MMIPWCRPASSVKVCCALPLRGAYRLGLVAQTATGCPVDLVRWKRTKPVGVSKRDGVPVNSDRPHPLISRAKSGSEVLAQVRSLLQGDSLTIGSLTMAIKLCARFSCQESLKAVQQEARDSRLPLSVVYYTTLVRAFSSLNLCEESRAAWDEMVKAQVQPDEVAYLAALKLCAKTGDRAWAEVLWADVSETSDRSRRRALMAAYLYVHALSADWAEVDRILEQMREEGIAFDAPLLGQLLDAARRTGSPPSRAQHYWDLLVEGAGVVPDELARRQLSQICELRSRTFTDGAEA